MTRHVASDGLPARAGGPWTIEKLSYVERYATAFMRAMGPKRRVGTWDQIVYIDLLAGPGKGVELGTLTEFDGSPLRALRVRPGFDKLFLGDARSRNVAVLKRRIAADDLARVEVEVGDCNERAGRVVRSLSPRTLGLAFIDPEGFEATFSMFRALSARPIDILLLFPSGIGIARNLRRFVGQRESPMDALWGGRDWRELTPAKLAAGKGLSKDEAESLDRSWVLSFRAKMIEIGYRFQDEADPCFRNEKNAPMYHLLFFSQHPAGLTIWRNIKRIEPTGQRALF